MLGQHQCFSVVALQCLLSLLFGFQNLSCQCFCVPIFIVTLFGPPKWLLNGLAAIDVSALLRSNAARWAFLACKMPSRRLGRHLCFRIPLPNHVLGLFWGSLGLLNIDSMCICTFQHFLAILSCDVDDVLYLVH